MPTITGASDDLTPQVGQIWREVDPRFNRFVRVYDVRSGRRGVTIRTVHRTDGKWLPALRSRLTYVDPRRFNGKSSGYEFYEASP